MSRALQELLTDHPNQLLVRSVCHSLSEGFLGLEAKHEDDVYPVTWDNSARSLKTQDEVDFVEAQIAKEVRLGRYSQAFGPGLLPGMYSSPLHTIPKDGADGYRLINDQSDGDYSPNSMICRNDIAGTCMDGIKELGASLRAFRREYGNDVELVVWKSDIHGAYHNMPLHPLFQLKQIVSFGDQRYVDHCNCFGEQEPHTSFGFLSLSLVCWIAITLRMIRDLKVYVDNNALLLHGLGDVLYYPLIKLVYFPSDQTKSFDAVG